jgi:hypothetical protein
VPADRHHDVRRASSRASAPRIVMRSRAAHSLREMITCVSARSARAIASGGTTALVAGPLTAHRPRAASGGRSPDRDKARNHPQANAGDCVRPVPRGTRFRPLFGYLRANALCRAGTQNPPARECRTSSSLVPGIDNPRVLLASSAPGRKQRKESRQESITGGHAVPTVACDDSVDFFERCAGQW